MRLTHTMLPASPARSRFTDPGRGLIAMSLLAGLAYPFADTALPLVGTVFIKGLSVGLLAVAAALLASPQRWWLAAILGAGAIGDVLLDVPGLFLFGAGAFAIGHIVAMLFYVREGRRRTGIGERLAAAALVGWGLVMPSLVSPPGTPIGGSMLYSVLLCGMAAALLLSRFSRTALAGALLFVVSDTLLIMRLGGQLVGGEALHGVMVWFSYYGGQMLIFLGVSSGLARR